MWSKTILLAFVVLSGACSKNNAVKPGSHSSLGDSGNSLPPLITIKAPAEAALAIPSNAKIKVTFNVDIDPATLIPANFYLKHPAIEAALPAAIHYDAASKTAELSTDARLEGGIAYNVHLGTEVKDIHGNALAEAEDWSFTTRPQGWTWISGASDADVVSDFGTIGVASASHFPGARDRANIWMDKSGKITVANGYAGSIAGPGDSYNDLWQWDGKDWTWLKGNIFPNQMGDYGSVSVTASTNMISARHFAADARVADTQYVFGGYSYDNAGGVNYSNDLWKWDGKDWTWVNGANVVSQPSVPGTKGVADPANHPGARAMATMVADKEGKLWVFGGHAFDEGSNLKHANDLWRWDGSSWTWISGGKAGNESGVYGTKGVPDPANVPGARQSAMSWVDLEGKIWIFGGYGYDSQGAVGNLNDLWSWDGTNWTWQAGGDLKNSIGNYGFRGKVSDTNTPGPRSSDGNNVVVDSRGHAWVYAGYDVDGQGGHVQFSDLWEWDGKNWIFIFGSETPSADANYGTKGIYAATNAPGSRNASLMIDGDDSLWIYGGRGKDVAGTVGNLSDLWQFNP